MPDKRQHVERAVLNRYSKAAGARETELCCPVEYESRYLEAIPQEILDRDYGCGNPSRHLRQGDTVLDLGSGGGKICYIASQIVGPKGRVIGIDINDDMLRLAEDYREEIGNRIGYHNVEFHKGKIQDLALDVRALEALLEKRAPKTTLDLDQLEAWKEEQRRDAPLIAGDSVDVVVSNCVLNLVRKDDREQLFSEIFRVLRRGGRAVISDIVSDESVPHAMQDDPTLWSGCISGAFREDRFLQAFERAGFHGIRLLKRDETPWQTVQGIEFRSVTVEAFKGKQGACLERNQAVIYKGPWRRVDDDDGHTLIRGERMAVCDKTYRLYMSEPYVSELIEVPPYEEVALDEAKGFDCSHDAKRHPRETKGRDYDVTALSDAPCCGPDDDCC